MKIIAEKINGTRKKVNQAILERDKEFIQDLAVQQADAGADWIDANAGTKKDREPEDLVWLVECIQEAVDTPICLDSANPEAIKAALKKIDQTPLINSISGEAERLNEILPLAAETNGPVIALAMDNNGIPSTAEKRIQVIDFLIEKTRDAGIPDERVYVDPLVLTIATEINSGTLFFKTIKKLSADYPEIHFTSGLSNISFGLPQRSLINRAFVTLAIEAGLDSAIMDPTDKDLVSAVYAAELVLGRDSYCRNYTTRFRNNEL